MKHGLSPAKTGLFLFLIGWFLITGTSCEWTGHRVSNKPVVQVNGTNLTTKEFSDQLARKLKNFDALGAKDPQNITRAKNEIVRSFILKTITVNYAEKEGIEVESSEIEKEINSFRASYPDDLSFRRALADESLSLADWREELAYSLLERKVFQKLSEKIPAPTDEEISKYYEENKARYKRTERILLRQIVTDDLQKAQSVRDEMKGKDFAEVAKKVSVAPEAKNGGLVGWVEKGSVDIFDKAFALPVGSLSQVLESSYGFHIFKVEKKMPAGFVEKTEVKEEIIQAINGKKEQGEFASWLDKQIRASRVLKDSAIIDAITVETRGKN
jgi:peptidyl-prolyl cis-trans isomerase C